jgi:hypothetical protein
LLLAVIAGHGSAPRSILDQPAAPAAKPQAPTTPRAPVAD